MNTFLKRFALFAVALVLSVSAFSHGEGPACVYMSVNGGASTTYRMNHHTSGWDEANFIKEADTLPATFGTPTSLTFIWAEGIAWSGQSDKCGELWNKFRVFYRISKGTPTGSWTSFPMWNCNNNVSGNNRWLKTEHGAIDRNILTEAYALGQEGTYILEMAIIYQDNATQDVSGNSNVAAPPPNRIFTTTFTIEGEPEPTPDNGEGPAGVFLIKDGNTAPYNLNGVTWQNIDDFKPAVSLEGVTFGTPNSLVFSYAQGTAWSNADEKCTHLENSFNLFYKISKSAETTGWQRVAMTNCTGIGGNDMRFSTSEHNKNLLEEAFDLGGTGIYTLEMAIVYKATTGEPTPVTTMTTPPDSTVRTATFWINAPASEPLISIAMSETILLRNETADVFLTAENADSVAVYRNGVFWQGFSTNIEAEFSEILSLTPTERGEHYLTATAINRFGFRVSDEIDFLVKDSVSVAMRFIDIGPNNTHLRNTPLDVIVELFDADSAVLKINNNTILYRAKNEDGFMVTLPTTLGVREHTLYLMAYGIRNSMAFDTLIFTVVQSLSNCPYLLTDERILVYPNPVTDGNLTVVIPSEARDLSAIVEIFDMSGKRVYVAKPPFTVYRSPFTINISHLPNGTYILRIDGKSKIIVKRE
jgi:hypothetical protein